MAMTSETGEIPPLSQAINNPMWDDEFWDRLSVSEETAKAALLDLYDSSYDGYMCSCDTCVVRTVLEAVWPELTNQFNRLLSERTEVQTMGGDCRTGCGCRRQS